MGRAEIKSLAKKKFKQEWSKLLLVLALTIPAEGIATVLGFGVGGIIVFGPLTIGIYYVFMSANRGYATNWKDMFMGFRSRFEDSFFVGIFLCIFQCAVIIGLIYFCISVVISMIGTVMAASMGGGAIGAIILALFNVAWVAAICVAGIILTCMYNETIFILIKETGTKAMEAMKKSRIMMKGRKKSLFVFELSYIGWFILVIITFGLAGIYVGPYYYSAKTIFLELIYEEEHNRISVDDVDSDELNILKNNLQDKARNISIKRNNSGEAYDSYSKREIDNTVEVQMMACRYCGAQLPEGAMFCGKCGKPQ